MHRPILLGAMPYLTDYCRKDTRTLFAETGGNSGNLAFMYAIANHIPSARIPHWGISSRDLRAAGDVVVLALANQLGTHTDLGETASRLEELGLPLIGLGLGAQAPTEDVDIKLTSGTANWLQTLARLCPSEASNLGVRGLYTQEQIAKLGLPNASVVTGCPSNTNGPIR